MADRAQSKSKPLEKKRVPVAVVMRTEPGVDFEERVVRVERRDEIRFGLRRFWSSPVIVRIHRLPRFSRLHIFAFVLNH